MQVITSVLHVAEQLNGPFQQMTHNYIKHILARKWEIKILCFLMLLEPKELEKSSLHNPEL